MKKWIKIFSVLAAVVVVMVIALVIIASVLITPERVKSAFLPLAEQKLHRKIELGEIKVNLFTGIEIHGLRVFEQNGQDTFLSTELVRLKYQLLPLLAMKVVVDEVLLEKPSIRVVRWKNGQFNFSDLLASGPRQENRATTPGGAARSNPVSLLVSQVLLQDGQVVFFDHVLNDQAPYRYEISALQVTAKGITLTGEIPLSLQCQLNGSPLSLEGHINLSPLGGTFHLVLQNLDMVPFTPYFQASLPGKLGSLILAVDAQVEATPGEVGLKGTLKLGDLDMVLDVLPDAPVKKARLSVDYDLQTDLGREHLDLRKLGLDYNGIKVEAKGTVAKLLQQPVIELAVTLPKQQISKAFDAVPQEIIENINSLDPTGAISGEASLAGGLKDPVHLLKNALIDLEDIQVTVGGQRPAFSGRLRINNDQLATERLHVRLGDNDAALAVSAEKIFSRPIIVRADITSDHFLLEPLFQGGAGSAAAINQTGSAISQTGSAINTPQPANEIGPFDIPLQASGTIKVGETLWKGLTIKDFLARYELKDNVLKLVGMEGKMVGGSFSNTARVDLGKKGLAYTATVGLQGVQVEPLLAALAPKAAGSLLGAMDLALKVDGRGTRWDVLSRNLSGDGNLLISNGRLISPELVKGLSTFLGLPELNDIQFKNFAGRFKIIDGKVRIDSEMISDAIKLFPKGNIGLDGSLDLGLDTRLSPALSKRLDTKGSVLGYLADSEGWVQVPLLLKGTFSSPSFGLDPKAAQEQASKAIGSKLGQQIDKLFKQPGTSTAPSDQQPSGNGTTPAQDPARKLLEDSLHKLFGN